MTRQNSTVNFLTLDVEEWFDAEIPRRKIKSIPDENKDIEEQINIYIELCNKLEIKSTCFVLGKLAEKKPHLVNLLHKNGHEIATHSYAHTLIYSMSPESFRKDLKRSINILENITGEKVKGFRAPSWSVNSDIASWFYKILEEEKLLYSSSIYPAKTFLYGMPGAPEGIHKPAGTSVFEIPQQLLSFRVFKIGFSGGIYLRILPARLIKQGIRFKNKQGYPVFIYLHPWELIYKKYPVNLSVTESIIQYWGISRNQEKIICTCKAFQNTFERMDTYFLKFQLD